MKFLIRIKSFFGGRKCAKTQKHREAKIWHFVASKIQEILQSDKCWSVVLERNFVRKSRTKILSENFLVGIELHKINTWS
jgi:hypothetical protein